MLPVQVADGYTVMMPKKTRSNASMMKARAMVRGYATPTTATMTDTPPARATYKMRMNQISTGAVGLGIDGQTKAYIKVAGKDAKTLFSSKYVPMTDGTDVLMGCDKKMISQRGYGNIVARKPVAVPRGDRIGFNNTLVDTSKGKIEPSMAYTKTYPNHTVCSDFPKGPGGIEPNPMWKDGTYDEMLGQVQKVHNEIPREMGFVPEMDRRREVFNLQSLAGGEVFGEALLRQEISNSVLGQKRDLETSKLSRLFPEATFGELQEAQGRLERNKRIADIAKRLGISVAAAEELENTVGETGLRTTEALLRGGDSRTAEALAPGFNLAIGRRRTAEEQNRIMAARAKEAEEQAKRNSAASKIASTAKGYFVRKAISEIPEAQKWLRRVERNQKIRERERGGAGTPLAEVFRRAVAEELFSSSSSSGGARGGRTYADE
jgi:hypothetical protein